MVSKNGRTSTSVVFAEREREEGNESQRTKRVMKERISRGAYQCHCEERAGASRQLGPHDDGKKEEERLTLIASVASPLRMSRTGYFPLSQIL